MAAESVARPKTARNVSRQRGAAQPHVGTNGSAGGYVVPLVHTRVPERVVDAGFAGALAGAVVLGAIELPIAIVVGAAVVIARHRSSR